ncbi:MAG: MBL fold metallo-hydrolase [Spirochaetes bacterium GWD1_61_31]|nr:MAG: MBL fold metallo-hydrolase [Spirochaetes bacterium GWB1_60_80]OHD34261.1 MAG: MBL fold metallo-hydrolase [Spirochaetes bacterium GWC1_61_12]OHD40189.1 MAG: MBL fold metallo-hydrolase [Spirochaetes bacterium GWD1_61_31]OHD45763.1 MAG: MBL fold metallo-hydrolase [Spirochaetes bacterium GWE1_60_18]OHD58307.1 MAG: MBL fold metallo-hydrolase [Spirochaetes bacterium GWF1_60_12]HAX37785.1 MBL fold metallo-hydrolase [Spirochaetaceae bacterium]
MFSVTIWGDRGSMPVPGPDTVVFGGNTACLEVRCGERIIIIDAGSGIRGLGDYLVRTELKKGPIHADIFLTHTHWDHIMGFPMFTPIYIPGTSLEIHGPVNFEDETLEQIIGAQLSYRYWPVRQDELAAKIKYETLRETMLDLGDGIKLRTKYLNHPVLCLGYRIEYEGKSFVTIFDHEPYVNLFPTNPTHPDYDAAIALEGDTAAREENAKIENFYSDANVLIHDTQYSAKEYRAGKSGWGHSSYEYAINAANRSRVKKLLLFHHDPNRTDTELQELELFYQAKLARLTAMEIHMAREGLKVII